MMKSVISTQHGSNASPDAAARVIDHRSLEGEVKAAACKTPPLCQTLRRFKAESLLKGFTRSADSPET